MGKVLNIKEINDLLEKANRSIGLEVGKKYNLTFSIFKECIGTYCIGINWYKSYNYSSEYSEILKDDSTIEKVKAAAYVCYRGFCNWAHIEPLDKSDFSSKF